MDKGKNVCVSYGVYANIPDGVIERARQMTATDYVDVAIKIGDEVLEFTWNEFRKRLGFTVEEAQDG